MRRLNVKHIRSLCFAAMVIVLYISFYNNSFDVVDDWRFDYYHAMNDTLVVARLAKNEHSGFEFMLLWPRGHWARYHDQSANSIYQSYFSGTEPKPLEGIYPNHPISIYRSTAGLQAVIYGLADSYMKFLGFEPKQRLKYMRRLTALALAITLSVFVMFIAAEFGVVGAGITFAAIFYSKYLTLYGSNMFLMLFFWFLPMLWCWRYYVLRAPPEGRAFIVFSAGFFALVLMKMLIGFDYMISILMGSGAVIVYGLSKSGFVWRRIFRHGSLLVVNAFAAFITALLITSILIYTIVKHSIEMIIDFWGGRFLSRVWFKTDSGRPGWIGAYETSFLDVFRHFFNFEIWGALSAFYIFCFLILLGLVFLIMTALQENDKRLKFWMSSLWQRSAALYLLGILSFLATFAHIFIFKNHAYANPYDAPVVWSVPALIIFPAVIWAMAQLIKARAMAMSAAIVCLAAMLILPFPLGGLLYSNKFVKVEMMMNRNKFVAPLKKVESGDFKLLFRSKFDVYFDKDKRQLVYITHQCGKRERNEEFFIHIFNMEGDVRVFSFPLTGACSLTLENRPWEKPLGNRYYGIRTCIYRWDLPNYKVKRIRTGQFEERKNAPPEKRWHNFWEGWADVDE